MHHVDRNSGILNTEESFSADERRSYQEKFLQEVVSHAYAAGTPLKAAMDARGIKPSDMRTAGRLADNPHHQEEGPFGGSESSATVRRIPHRSRVRSSQDTPVTRADLRSCREGIRLLALEKRSVLGGVQTWRSCGQHLRVPSYPRGAHVRGRGFRTRGHDHPHRRR